jgi:superfamily II DNA or RNA helicase/DNA-binding XRE family transcriptional regulator
LDKIVKHEIPSDCSQRIQRLRTQAGLSQSSLAELIGVSPAAVNHWESGKTRPSWKRWQQILRAEALGVHALRQDFVEQVVRESSAGFAVQAPPEMDFSTDPEVVRLVTEGQRLAYGHQVNPTYATEISQIQPLPHQHIAVYERLLKQPRLRFLLADDAGAGKTIMAGLYIREMLSRRLIQRVLIVPPAGLVGNWESEMRTLFSLPFRPIEGSDATGDNPFVGPDSDLAIVSVDTLAGERTFSRLQGPEVLPYDLVIFDEAHKLAARAAPNFRIVKTYRYRLAEALAGVAGDDPRWQLPWSCQHLLLMTATPHMGKDFPYYCLWRLLEPEALATYDAFQAFPAQARRRHFIRRTKEEMVDFEGKPIYPRRVSDTLSYDLTQGEVGEQRLYEETSQYISTFYNRARILNRSAVRLAMSVFQRRLASSTYAMLCSLENRLQKVSTLIDDVQSGRISLEELARRQHALDGEAHDVFDEATADEEESVDGQEASEAAEDRSLAGFVFRTLVDLEIERREVERLRDLARQIYEDPTHQDSKFAKLLDVIRDPRYQGEKLIIFTEHRDTMSDLIRRLEQLGYTGEVAQIHGGMPYREREAQVEFFRKPVAEGGARYLVATDAAGEGINLQFCWLMVNYDVPWNPARLEQRMGRIHRYGQTHNPVIIVNLVAGKTREGRVLKTLLDKLKVIGEQLGHDKVFDVVGRLFQGTSLTAYMEQALTEEGADAAAEDVSSVVTAEQVEALRAQERQVYGEGQEIRSELARLQADRDRDRTRKLLPGQVRRFVEQATRRLGVGIEGDLDGFFALRPVQPGALDPLWPVLESYPPEHRSRLTIYQEQAGKGKQVIFVRPGEPLFNQMVSCFYDRFGRQALRGATFVDPTAAEPYLFHLVQVEVVRQADAAIPAMGRVERIETRLVGLKQSQAGQVEVAPVEQLLLLRGGPGIYGPYVQLAAQAKLLREGAWAYAVEQVARPMAEAHRDARLKDLPERVEFVRKGYDYQEAELAEARRQLRDRAQQGDPKARAGLDRVKTRQRALAARRRATLAALEREPELITAGEVTFLAHALVIPSDDPEDRERYDKSVELEAVRQAWGYEEAHGAVVTDVSTPALALAAGQEAHPGYDLLSRRPDGEILLIEVKGRAAVGDVELKENEWIKACTNKDSYWLYVVYRCATGQPELWRVRNPFFTLVARAKGDVVVGEQEIFRVAEA